MMNKNYGYFLSFLNVGFSVCFRQQMFYSKGYRQQYKIFNINNLKTKGKSN